MQIDVGSLAERLIAWGVKVYFGTHVRVRVRVRVRA